jgi:uncharacterized protein YxeA
MKKTIIIEITVLLAIVITCVVLLKNKNEGNENTVPPELANVEKVENGIEPAMYGAWRLLSVRDSLGNDESFDITGKIRLHISSTAVVIKSYYEKSEYKELSSKYSLFKEDSLDIDAFESYTNGKVLLLKYKNEVYCLSKDFGSSL